MTGFKALASAMVKGFMRDRTTLFFTLLFPLFFILIFGALFTDNGASKQKVVEIGQVALLDRMPADAKKQIGEFLQLQPSTDRGAALRTVEKGDAAAAVEQQGNTIVVHTSRADAIKAAQVEGALSSIVAQANQAATGQAPRYTSRSETVSDTSMKAIQYITPGMTSYGIAVGACFGAAMTLIEWRRKKVLRRLRLSPAPTSSIVGSRVVVSLGVAIVQLAIFIGVAMMMGLKLKGAWYMAIPLVLAGTLTFMAIGLLIGCFTKTAEGGSAIANLIILPMSFLGGAFVPIDSAPGWIKTLSQFLPLGWLVKGLTAVMARGQGASAAFVPILELLALAVVLTAIGSRFFRWDAD